MTPEFCAAITWRGQPYGDTPEPDEFCENEAEPDSEFCDQHREGDGE